MPTVVPFTLKRINFQRYQPIIIIIISFFQAMTMTNKQTGKPCQIQVKQVDIKVVQCHMTPSIIGGNIVLLLLLL